LQALEARAKVVAKRPAAKPAAVKAPVKAKPAIVKAPVAAKPAVVPAKPPVKAAVPAKPPVKAHVPAKAPVKAAVPAKPPVKAAVPAKAPVKANPVAAKPPTVPAKAPVTAKPPTKVGNGAPVAVKPANGAPAPAKPAASAKPSKLPKCTAAQVEARELEERIFGSITHPDAAGTITLFHGTTAANAAALAAGAVNLALTRGTGDFNHRPGTRAALTPFLCNNLKLTQYSEVPGGFYLTDSLIAAAQFACFGISGQRPVSTDVVGELVTHLSSLPQF
jgi:hypothetical protein